MQPPALAQLDAWIAKQEDEPTRPEAMRRLVEIALKRCALATTVTRLTEEAKANQLQLRALFASNEKTTNAYKVVVEATRQSYVFLLNLLTAGRNNEAIYHLKETLTDLNHDDDEPARN